MINRKKIIVVILSICISYVLFIQGQYIYDTNKEFSPTKCFSKELADFVIAAERGKIRKMRSLYKKGNININDVGKCGITPLIWMLRWITHTTDEPFTSKRVSHLNKQVLKELLQLGSDPNFVTLYGESAVYRAAGMAPTPILKILLDNGGNPNIINPKTKETALYRAIYYLDNVKLLISYGANINFKVSNESLLLHSIISDRYEVAVYLLDKDIDIIPAEIPKIIRYVKSDQKSLAKEFLYLIDDIKAALLKRGVNVDDAPDKSS